MNGPKMVLTGVVLTGLALLLGVDAAHPQNGGDPSAFVRLLPTETVMAPPGGSTTVRLTMKVKEGWHINANPPTEGLIPTEVRLSSAPGFELLEVRYPEARRYSFSFSDKPVRVYEGEVPIPLRVRLPDRPVPEARPGVTVRFQACNDRICKRPMEISGELPLRVVASPDGDAGDAAATTEDGGGTGGIARYFQSGAWWLGLGAVFLLGLSLNLTPCVYPMVPITVGFFGDRQNGSLRSRVVDGVLFVLGMSLVYSGLGAVAGVSGSLLGSTLQNPFVLIGLAGLMVVMAGSVFGLYELRVPRSLRRGSDRLSDRLGSLGMGATLGVVAAPCLAPSTVALLAYVGQTESYAVGSLMFFVMALGLGFPYLFLAVFSSSLSSLPSSGAWLGWVEKLIGFVVLGVALYFVWPLVSNAVMAYLVIAWLGVTGAVLVYVHRPTRRWVVVVRALVVVGLVGAGMYVTYDRLLSPPRALHWQPATQLVKNSGTSRPTLVYVGADWCVPCKEMEVTTFQNQRFLRSVQRMRTVKIDLSDKPDESVGRWLTQHRVAGVPTILFLSPSGKEIRSLRVQGYVSGRELHRKVQRLRQRFASLRGPTPAGFGSAL